MEKEKSKRLIRHIYLYLVTAITIVLVIISTIGMINLALSEYVFDVKGYEELDDYKWQCGENATPVAVDDRELNPAKSVAVKATEEDQSKCLEDAKANAVLRHENDVKRDFVNWLSMLLVSLPLYFYHWGIIKKEK